MQHTKCLSPCRFSRTRTLILLGSGVILSACSASLPPAVPAEQILFEQPASPVPGVVPRAPLPAPEGLTRSVTVDLTPIPVPTLEVSQTPPPRRKSKKPGQPDAVIRHANSQSRIGPTRKGYAEGQSAVQRYPYLPGKLYEIYTSPNHPTTIVLPPGERLAAPPTLNPEAWDVGVVEMGEGATRQEAVIVRPLTVGQEATMPLLTQSGRAFFCRMRSFEKTSMVAVTWDIPRLSLPGIALEPPTKKCVSPGATVTHSPLVGPPVAGGQF